MNTDRATPLDMEHYRATVRRIRDDGKKLTAAAQYRRDLETLHKAEQQIVQEGGQPDDFFRAMGELHRQQGGES